MDSQPQHQRRGAGVYGDGQDEPDGRGVGVPHERRSSVLQGEGGDAVGGHAGRVTLPAIRLRG